MTEEGVGSGATSSEPARPAAPAPSNRAPTSWAFFVLVGFVLGNGTGYLGGLFVGAKAHTPDAPGGVDSEPTTEAVADLSHPRFVEGRGWSVSYPANWTLSATSSGEDPDREFSIESTGASSLQLSIRDQRCDLNEELAQRLVSYGTRLIEGGERSELGTWGRYPGRGQELRGNLAGAGPGTFRVFTANVGERSFTAIERFAEEDRKAIEPGFRLIQESFTLK